MVVPKAPGLDIIGAPSIPMVAKSVMMFVALNDEKAFVGALTRNSLCKVRAPLECVRV